MRILSILLTVVLSLALAACPPSDTPTEDATEAPAENTETTEDAVEAVDPNTDAVGAALSGELNPTAVADIAADPQAFADKTIQVLGVPSAMCGSGCSMTMEDGEAKLKIRSDTEVFKFPAGWKGQEVLVEGVVSVDPGCGGHHEAKAGEAAEAAEGEAAKGEAAEGEAPEGEATEKEHAHGEHHAEGGGFVLMATGARLVAPAVTDEEPPAEGAAEAPAEAPAEAAPAKH